MSGKSQVGAEGTEGALGRSRQATLIRSSRGESAIILNHGSTMLVAQDDGSVTPDGASYGLYADDTRFLSRHELRINGKVPRPLAFSRVSGRRARWHLLAEDIAGPEGVRAARVEVSLDRVLTSHRLHEDIALRTYGREPLRLLVAIALESDFADIFEVRLERWQRRSELSTRWGPRTGLETRYDRDDFTRRCLVRTMPGGAGVSHANGTLRFPVDLVPGEEWRICLQYDLLIDTGPRPVLASHCPVRGGDEDEADRHARHWADTVTHVRQGDLRLRFAYEQAIDDFAALRLYDKRLPRDLWVPAAGLPWFAALFGRDAVIGSLQAMIAQPTFALGTLDILARWQATAYDAARDAQPGKICHELRVGEWAHFGTIPHRPYYGTADATPLYLLLMADAHRWLGDADALASLRPTAERCLEWIDRDGDCDGDGFQEYAPRSPQGYRNQCWRDSEDGVLDEAGGFPEHPIATCEMQAYVYAAKSRVADLFDAWGDASRARALRREAAELRKRFHEVFWLDPPGELAFALDGRKRAVRTVTSNPGHCLWLGMLDTERGRAAGARLMRPDMFTGWGLRTLSSEHPSYDPHEYQRGSVWPHDTVIAAAGLRRYGMVEEAWRLLDGLLSAVGSFERAQMPELFSGLERDESRVPVPYRGANVPQAWGAGAVLQSLRVLLGLEPDIPAGRLYVDPALPPWCPSLDLDNLRIGPHRVRISARRIGDGSTVADLDAPAGVDVIRGTAPWMAVDPA